MIKVPNRLAFRYILFNKPFNVLSQFTSDDPGIHNQTPQRTLAGYISLKGVYPVGRLDRDSEGLLLLTDDGPLQHRLTDPRYGHPRTYWVQVEGVITPEALRQLERGVTIQEYRTLPAKAQLLPEPAVPPRDPPIRYRKNIPTSWVELTLREGRNRQVRRMTAAVGFPTLRLMRVAIGELRMQDLPPGEWRELEPAELKRLREA
jgi:23S rRNA pseudouridine2457 synthase